MYRKCYTRVYYDSVEGCFARKVHVYDLTSCFTKPQIKVLFISAFCHCWPNLVWGRVIFYWPPLQDFHSLLLLGCILLEFFPYSFQLISHVLFCSQWHIKCSQILHLSSVMNFACDQSMDITSKHISKLV